VRTALEILKRGDGNSPMAAEARRMMERQLRQMVRLVDDLLDVSRITTGKLALKPAVCELRDIIRSAVDTAQPLIDARRHTLTVVVPDEPLYVSADATRLAQVFSNLLNNAANYTEPGGRIQLAADADDTSVTVRVIDNGIGIADEMLGPVFQMFAQADESLERVHGGLGVGLTLARHLVELHNGTIEAQSEGAGRGSTFVVRLPRAPAAPRIAVHNAAPPSGGEAPNASTAGKRVLIADDNVDFATSLEAILTALGHDVLVTHDGDAALETALRVVPDIAFVDIGLPGRNGYDVARSIRERGINCKLIAVTGWGQDDDRRRSREAGFDVHLVKPVEPQLIIDIVDAQEAAVPAT
jgi:CheY-like chemotaxis protein